MPCSSSAAPLATLLALTALAAAPVGGPPQDVCLTRRMSLDTSGGDANGVSRKPSLSADGKWVAFESTASDLVAGDNNGFSDVFLTEVATGNTVLVSGAIQGGFANGDSTHASISADGRYTVFESEASDIVDGDGNDVRDVFRYDRDTGMVQRASVSTDEAEANGSCGAAGLWRGSAVSGDGNLVVFQSFANNLVIGDTNLRYDIFVRDMAATTTTLVSATTDVGGTVVRSNGVSQDPAISRDGAYVAYRSWANNLAPGDTNNASDIFRTELATLTTVRVSVATDGTQADGECGQPALSGNGDFVAFESFATTLATGNPAGDTNGQIDVFRRHVSGMVTERVSVTWDGQQTSGYAKSPSITDDGAKVAFTGNAATLVPGGNGIQSVYVRDVVGGTTERWGESTAGDNGFAGSDDASFSAGGEALAFLSLAPLEPLDGNSLHDIYLRACGPTATGYCPGLADTCPCANGGDGASGCANTAGTGALLTAAGVPSVANDTVQLTASGLPASVPVLFFQGTNALNGSHFGDGLRCVGGATRRLAIRFAMGGVASYGTGGDLPLSVRGSVDPAGQTLNYQAWYRDPMAFCTPEAFNLSSAVTVHWAP